MPDKIAKYQKAYEQIMSLYNDRIGKYGYKEQQAFELADAALFAIQMVACEDNEVSIEDYSDYILCMDIIRRAEE